MPFASGSGSSILLGDTAYYCGGIDESINDTVDTCAMMDVSNGEYTWTDMPSMPEGVNHAAHCTDGLNFYIIGGRKGGNTVSEAYDYNQVYNTRTKEWKLLAPLPVPKGGAGQCVVNGGQIYVIGGESNDHDLPGVSDSGTYKYVDIYDMKTDSWSVGPELQVPRHGIWPVVIEDKIIIAGGGDKSGYS